MPLYLAEADYIDDPARLDEMLGKVAEAGAEVIETQAIETLSRLIVIIEARNLAHARHALEASGPPELEPKPVRLVGQDVESVRRRGDAANYLVEWNLPGGLTMEHYLKRKAERTPLYAEVPEVNFERTYVCEDLSKCLCLYDAPDEEAVRRARRAVGAPVDALAAIRGLL